MRIHVKTFTLGDAAIYSGDTAHFPCLTAVPTMLGTHIYVRKPHKVKLSCHGTFKVGGPAAKTFSLLLKGIVGFK